MNILPKKRWHVRTRENIARVRKDEQEAAAEVEEKKQRILRAEKEARTALLRQRAHHKYGIPEGEQEVEKERDEPAPGPVNSRHVNFFEELEEGKIVTTKINVETELEEKEKREKYEKQIGYLTYLGQDTVESTGNIPWYEKVPDYHSPSNSSKDERNMKSKLLQDPLTVIRKYLPLETKNEKKTSDSSKRKCDILEYQSILKRKKAKKRKKSQTKKSKKRRKRSSSNSSSCSNESSSDSDSDEEAEEVAKRKSLEVLRAERLKREKEERERTEALLNKIHGKTPEQKKEPITPVMQQKYNSQYNPELAKQNYSKSPWNKGNC